MGIRHTGVTARPWMAARGALLIAGLVALAPLAGVEAADTVYRWTGPDGSVHYGAVPPAGVDAEPVETFAGGSAASDGADSAVDDAGAADSADADGDPSDEPPGEAAAAQPRPLSEEQCERLAHNRMLLESQPGRLVVEGEDGEPRRMPNEERERRLERAETMLAERC